MKEKYSIYPKESEYTQKNKYEITSKTESEYIPSFFDDKHSRTNRNQSQINLFCKIAIGIGLAMFIAGTVCHFSFVAAPVGIMLMLVGGIIGALGFGIHTEEPDVDADDSFSSISSL